MKKFLVVLCVFVMVAQLFIVCACNNNEQEPVGNYPTEVPTYTKSDDKVFYVAAFTAPPKISAEAYQLVADCGINHVYLDPWANSTSISNENQIVKVMEVAEQAGVKILIMPNNSHEKHIGDPSDFTESGFVEDYTSFEDFTKDYTQYPAFAGFYVFDEPDSRQFDWIAEDYQKWTESKYADYKYLITMMNSDSNHRNSSEFIQLYMDTVGDKMTGASRCMSFDDYPLTYNTKTEKSLIGETVCRTFATVAHFCKEYDVKFYNFIQTLGYGYGANRQPETLEDIRWQVALGLAFGAQGFETFTYRSLSNGGFTEAMVSGVGKPTDIYYFCKQSFEELHSWEHVYLSFDYQGTMIYDSDAPSQNANDLKSMPYAVTEHDRIKSYSSTRDLLIGTFKDANGYDGFSFCTYNDPYYQKYNQIHVEFNSASKAVVYLNGVESVIDLTNGVFDYEIAAGDVLFVIPVQ